MRVAVKETETEDLFAILANESPVALCIIQDGKFCYTNPTFQRNTGYREDELLGRDSLELVVPEDREKVKENTIKTLNGELTSPYQVKVTHKTGSIRWVTESVSSVQYCGRRAILGYFIDITERKQMEEALQDEKNKLQSLIGAIEDNINIQDRDYNIIFQNKPSKISSGGDHMGEKCYRVFEGAEKVCKGCPVEKAFKDGKSHTSERQRVLPSGELSFWENMANPIRDAKGEVVSCLEFGRNITERKRMEEALRDSEEKLRKMFESVTDGILVIDLKGRITEVNQRAVEMHGFSSKDELRGKSAFELVAPRDHEKIAAHMKKAIKREAIRGIEYTLLRADGSEFPGELSTSALRDASDNVIGHITIVRNITERRRAEEEREALLQDITKSNRKLEGANKELQDFVYVASHDLREPLRKISSFGTLIQDSLKEKLDEDQQENLEFMIDGSQRMQDMVDALLSYSRLTTKAKPPQQVFLNEVIEELKKLELATLLDETQGTIHIPEPLPPVQADPFQMTQLFQNLIGNGLKFHKEGIPPEITIRAHGVENKMVRIEIEDNGIGIDEKYHEQLFVMFKRLHSRAQYEGTGIGLASCKKIVERHGGNIGVKSTPGKGSTFWFTLPRGSYIKES
jgi:PAS domain S-box-containing protein